jgi:hypothetical protein
MPSLFTSWGIQPGVPVSPQCRDMLVMSRALTIPSLLTSQVALPMAIEMLLVALAPVLSVTLKVIEVGPPVMVGVPKITPSELIVNPTGNVPETIDQVYGIVPPVAVNVCE